MNGIRHLRDLPLRTQLMLVFALLSVFTTAVSTVTLTALASHRAQVGLRDKSVQYARQLQQQLESVVAFDDHLTARELFSSLMVDHDVEGLAVYAADGRLIEGRGSPPARLVALSADIGTGKSRVVALANIRSPEGRDGRLYVGLSTRSVDELRRREAWIATAIAAAVMLCAVALASRTSLPITRRLVKIAAAADRMAAGDLTHAQLDDRSRDEIGALSHAFNLMVSELKRMSAEHEHRVLTERERLETLVSERTQSLEQSREMFRLMAESTNAIPFTLDLGMGAFPYIGAQGVASSAFAETQWQCPGALDLILPRDRNHEIRRHFDECAPGRFEFEATMTQSDGKRVEMRWMGTCEMIDDRKILRGLMQNVTELRRLERELTAAQKLESVGRLAAGVAHEINTPVQFVSDNVQFVRSSVADVHKVIQAYRGLQTAARSASGVEKAAELAAGAEIAADLDYLMTNVPLAIDGAVEGLDRIATIVRSMKEFAHPDQAQKTSADLNQAIRSTLVIANNEYKYVARLHTDFGEVPLVQCYLGEINQVILNLLINAAHAIGDSMSEGSPLGTLTVRTQRIGDEVEIAIGDTGTGIPEAARDKIFDPFFTTKEVGKGTGQGLAIARSVVVNKHAGTLRFETECGKGTTFFIRLPIDASAEAADADRVAA